MATNTEKILSLITPMVKDIYTTPEELSSVLTMVYEEIMYESKPLKKMYQLTLFEDQDTYDLETMAILGDQYETGISGRTLTGTDLSTEEIISVMKSLTPIVKPAISFTTEPIIEKPIFISVDEIFTDAGYSVMDKFNHIYGHVYHVEDINFLKEFNDTALYYVGSVGIQLDDIEPSMLSQLMPVIVQGVKFYIYNDPVTKSSDVANNYQAMRFYKAKETFLNLYAQKVTLRQRSPRWL